MAKLKIQTGVAKGPGMVDVVNKQGQPGVLNMNSPMEKAMIPSKQMDAKTLKLIEQAMTGKKKKGY